jgi:hypothetical protein
MVLSLIHKAGQMVGSSNESQVSKYVICEEVLFVHVFIL